jgi:hypothetical protein
VGVRHTIIIYTEDTKLYGLQEINIFFVSLGHYFSHPMRLFYFLIIIPLWMLPLYSTASLKVLLCQEGLSLKSKDGNVRKLAPGDAIETGGILEAIKYPAHIALYDSTGKFFEKKILQPTPVREIELILRKSKKKPFADSLIKYTLNEMQIKKRSLYGIEHRQNNIYKSLSHLRATSPYRCPGPAFQILGTEKCKVEPKAYTLYIHRKDTAQGDVSLFFSTATMMDEVLETRTFLSLKQLDVILLDLTKKHYKDHKSIILKLKNNETSLDECDSKFIELISSKELALKNSGVKKLRLEFSDQSSPLSNYLLAMVLEDHQMYLDSAELYIKAYLSLSGSDSEFNNVLYNYLLSTYRIN